MSETERPYGPYAALLSVQFFFGSLSVVGKVVLNEIPSFSLVGFRVGITAFILVVIQMIRGRVWLKERRDYWKLGVLSFFGVALNQALFISGLSLTKASNASLLAVTIPVFALTVGAVAGLERLRLIKVAGIVIAAMGVVFLIDPRSASFSSQTTIGDMLIILNSLSFGIYVATSKSIVTRNGAFRSMMWVFVFASLLCVPLGIYSISTIDIASVRPAIWASIFYIAIGATTAPYLLNALAITKVNPSTVAVFVYLQPLIGFVMAVIFLGERVDLKFLAAATLVFAGVFLVTKRQAVATT